MHDVVLQTLFFIFAGAAVAASMALYSRQSLLVAYILAGVLLGPSVLGWVASPDLVRNAASIGIIFLLFLLGTNLHPRKLVQVFSRVTLTTLVSAAVFALIGFGVGRLFGFAATESLVLGAATMFSSTILGLKLLPATALHHGHIGEVVIGILLLQDLLAIIVLIGLQSLGAGDVGWPALAGAVLALPGLVGGALLAERYLLRPLWARFDSVQEYIFLTAIAWCLVGAVVGGILGLSHEVGAFIAGVAVANSPIARFIAESLRPLRDFFLIVYFFALGAGLDLATLDSVWAPGLVLAGAALAVKPWVFGGLLSWMGEERALGREVGVRLGQMSEFALFVAMVAMETGAVGERAGYVIQLATVATFIASSLVTGARYPTPVAATAARRRD